MRLLSVLATAGLCLLGGVLAGCDSAPGPPSPDERPPVLFDFDFSPRSVVFEQLPPDQIAGDLVRVPVELSVSARDADGDLETVRFLVQPPFSTSETVAAGEMTPAGNGRFTATATVEIPKSDVGVYSVVVFAVDGAGQMSNQARGEFAFEATGEPPVIEDVALPERVTRPAPGEDPVLIPIVATVSDPDGLANIARVEMQVLPIGSVILQLCDDGGEGACNPGFGSSGDETAGDGRFTITLQLDSSNAPGETTFEFRAIDRAGLTSETVTRTITVE